MQEQQGTSLQSTLDYDGIGRRRLSACVHEPILNEWPSQPVRSTVTVIVDGPDAKTTK